MKYLGKFYLYRVLKLLQCVSSGLDKFRTNTGLTQYYIMKTPYVKNEQGEMSLLWTQRNIKSPRSFYKTVEYILNENTNGHFWEGNPIMDKLEGLF